MKKYYRLSLRDAHRKQEACIIVDTSIIIYVQCSKVICKHQTVYQPVTAVVDDVSVVLLFFCMHTFLLAVFLVESPAHRNRDM